MPAGLIEMDYNLGWKLSAGKSGVHNTRYYEVVYNINSLGFRDKPRMVMKDENIYRILLSGDSQVYGLGIPEDQRFSNLIENKKTHLEIWNLAGPGYGLDQQILCYERDGKFFNADEVIFFVAPSTLQRIHYDYIYKKHKPMFVTDHSGSLKLIPIPKGKTAMTSLLYDLLSPMYLPYFVELRLKMLTDIKKKSSFKRDQETNIESITSRARVGDFEKKMLIMARNIAVGRKQRITILSALPEATRKDLQAFCDQNGIGLLEIALDGERNDLRFGRYDRHWNIEANKLIADQLLSQLERNVNR